MADLVEERQAVKARELARSKAYDGPWHRHPTAQVFAVLEGLAVLRTPETSFVMPPGRLCWIPPDQPHGANTWGPIRVASVHLEPALASRVPPSPKVVVQSRLAAAVMERLTRPGAARLGDARTRHLCEVLLDEVADGSSRDLRLPMPREPRLQEVAQILLEDPTDARTLDAWAARTRMSRRTLTRRFRAESGLSFAQWRQQARLLRALQCMAEGQSVTEAAMSVGYDSLSAFIALFRKYLGVTPGEYRVR